jgi:uncharacterized membrane protein YphA (DoxX/SURF4 family)
MAARAIGRIPFAVAVAAFGIQHVLYAASLPEPVPGPPWTPTGALAWIVAAVLLVAAGVIAGGRALRPAAGAAAAVVFFAQAGVHVARLVDDIRKPGPWTGVAELVCLGGVAIALAGARRAGRVVYGIPLVVFGVQHIMYADFVATLVPAWIPGQLFWAYFVAAAFFAAAAALATGIRARLAATLLGVMFATFVVVLHVPRAVAAHGAANECTSLLVALAMAGGAFVVGED